MKSKYLRAAPRHGASGVPRRSRIVRPRYLFANILVTGGIVLGLELAASRILTPFFGVSLYVWSGILSVTLIALALGYKGGGIIAAKAGRGRALLFFAAAGAMAALWLDICLWTYPYIFWTLADFNLVAGSIAACWYLLFLPLVILSALNPLLIALLADERSTGDHGAGSVFFISTVGSVLGVFMVAYGLLPHLTNYRTVDVLALASATLSLTGLLMIRDFTNRMFRIFFFLTVAAFLIAAATLLSGGLERFAYDVTYKGWAWHVVHAEPSSFGNLKVIDCTKGQVSFRMLLNDGMVQNEIMRPSRSIDLFTYALENLAFAAAPGARKALVLGIGAGVVPTAFAKHAIDVQAVDINRKMVKVAKDYLGFKTDNIRIEIQDARPAVRHCRRDNDIVAVDLFHDDGIPEHLVTREFFSDIKSCMSDRGVMVMNSFMKTDAPQAQYALLQTIAAVFGEVYFAREALGPGSNFTSAFIVVRKGGPVGPLDVSLSDVPSFLTRSLSESVKTAEIFKPGDPALRGAPVLSDVSNQWKYLDYPMELAYRRISVTVIPWQILMN